MSESNVTIFNVDQFEHMLDDMFPKSDSNVMGTFQKMEQEDSAVCFYGPFGTAVFYIAPDAQTAGYYVSVNGDPAYTTFFLNAVRKYFPDLEFYGGYSENVIEGKGEMILDEAGIANQRMVFVMRQAEAFKEYASEQKRNNILVPDKKIIV